MNPEVFGFAQSGEVGGGAWVQDLRMNLLTTIAYFGVNIAADGSVINNDYGYQVWASAQMTNMINSAHASGDRVVLTIKQFDTPTIASITGNDTNRQNCIRNVINELTARGGDGVNIDFEGYDSSAASRSNFTTFVGELQSALRSQVPRASYLTVDTYGSSAQGGTMFDIGGLRPYVDAFDVMAYDLTSINSAHAGPTAPLNGYPYTDNSILNDYLNQAQVPASQVILGVPYYGYKWSVTTPTAQAPTLSGGTADTYSGALADFACAQQVSLHFDNTFVEPWATWYSPSSNDPCGGNRGAWRELYYENAASLGAKYDLVNAKGVRGIGIWALGYDSGHTELWDEIAAKFNTARVGALAGRAGVADFNADRKTDLTVFRPSTSTWWTRYSGGSSYSSTLWGQAGDIPVIGDYDGDGRSDDAIFRPSTGEWWIKPSNGTPFSNVVWGHQGDIPVPGDYDGDGRTDPAVYRPGTGEWWILYSSGVPYSKTIWGVTGDIAVPGDYSGDGTSDLAVFRPSSGAWWILDGGSYRTATWGQQGDVPVPGDYDADGKTDLAIYRPGTREWWIPYSSGIPYTSSVWGSPGDIPMPGDYDGDGRTDTATYRPSTGTWWVSPSGGGAFTSTLWGVGGDVPLVLPSAVRQVFYP